MKKLLFMLLLAATFTAIAQREAIVNTAMPAPVLKKPMNLSAKLTKRIWFFVNGERYFWDCQEVRTEGDNYVAITRYTNGTTFERIVPIKTVDYISNIR